MVRSDARHHVDRHGMPRVVQQHARVASSRACGAPAASSSQIRPSSVHFDVLLHGAGCAGRCNALIVVRPSISLARWVVARHRAPTRTRAPTNTRAPPRARSSQISLSRHLGRQAHQSRSTSTRRHERSPRRSALLKLTLIRWTGATTCQSQHRGRIGGWPRATASPGDRPEPWA